MDKGVHAVRLGVRVIADTDIGVALLIEFEAGTHFERLSL